MYTGTVGLGVSVKSGLAATGAPPADVDEGARKREDSDSADDEHRVPHQ